MAYNIIVTSIASGSERDELEGKAPNIQKAISIEIPKAVVPSEDTDSPDSEATWQRRVMTDKFTWQTLVNTVHGLDTVVTVEPEEVIFSVKKGFDTQQLIPQIQTELSNIEKRRRSASLISPSDMYNVLASEKSLTPETFSGLQEALIALRKNQANHQMLDENTLHLDDFMTVLAELISPSEN